MAVVSLLAAATHYICAEGAKRRSKVGEKMKDGTKDRTRFLSKRSKIMLFYGKPRPPIVTDSDSGF